MKGRLKKTLIVAGVVISVIILIHSLGLGKYLSLEALKENREYLKSHVEENYFKAVIIYILLYATIISTAIPAVPPLTLIGGALFDVIPGGIYATIGAVLGTSISFLLIRYVLGTVIRGKYAEKLTIFNEKIKSHGVASYLLTMQLMGLLPYFIINTLAALAHVSFMTFLWTTCLGSLPIIFIYAFAGRQISFINSIGDIFSPSIILIILLFLLISFVPFLVRFIGRCNQF
jgi:uncharacterized membrane protein YdjX (TVP38/TMEM64 family)